MPEKKASNDKIKNIPGTIYRSYMLTSVMCWLLELVDTQESLPNHGSK